MAKTTQSTARAKAEARTSEATTRKIAPGAEAVAGLAGKFTDYAEGSARALRDTAAVSGEAIRELGARNMNFMTHAMEQGMEMTQALASVRDPREMLEVQSGFARSMFSAYTAEMTAQTEICMGAWREVAKPFMQQLAK